MAERAPEQERAREIAREIVHGKHDGIRFAEAPGTEWLGMTVARRLARAYLALLAAYEDRSVAFERSAADCVRLEGENAKLLAVVEAAQAHVEQRRSKSGVSQWPRLLNALDSLSPAEAEDEQHAHAEHLREAREVEQHQEQKHGE